MPAGSGPAVLYVDDEAINLRVFEVNFKQHFQVLTASSGAVALQILESGEHEIAVVLSDQRMPQMNGVELLEKAKTLAPDAYRIMITAYTDLTAVMEAINRGQIARYVVKPWNKEELRLVLDDAMRIYGLQARLRDVESRMLKSAHLVAIGQVSAGIAHELANPLTYVTQNLSSLRRDMATVCEEVGRGLPAESAPQVHQILEDLPHLLDDLESGVKHIRQIALAVRAQARGEDAEGTADVKEVVQFVVKMSSLEARGRAKVIAEGPSLMAKIGSVSLTQVVLNLVVNAAQAMEGLGRKGRIEIRWENTPAGVSLKVIDDGGGIAPENLERVFEPLFTTKPVGVGTGLGLSICRELMRVAGGDVRLTSKVGEGTTVEVLIPKVA
jgi:two-component system NtrC family sensor kinase